MNPKVIMVDANTNLIKEQLKLIHGSIESFLYDDEDRGVIIEFALDSINNLIEQLEA